MNIEMLNLQDKMIDGVLDQVPTMNPFLYGTDSYKVSHINFETNGVKEIYSNFTARFSHYMRDMLGESYDNKFVVFGIQWLLLRIHAMAKKGFFDRPKDEVIAEMKRVHFPYIGNDNFEHFEKLHDLGFLPIVVKSVDEGTLLPVGLPFLTIRNTLPEFEWLPNYLETLISTDLWKQLTVATIAREYRKLSNAFGLETNGNIDGTEWQNHDFSCRGQSGLESSAINGVAFLLSSCGTDNISALWAAEKFYNSRVDGDQLLAGSVAAGEHSVTTLGILVERERAKNDGEDIDVVEAEYRYKRWLLTERFPTGIVSDVSDSFDYWGHITKNLPRLKDVIMARDGKYVVRGDSGNPVHIIAGYRILEIDDDTSVKMLMEIVAKESRKLNGAEVILYKGQYHKILRTDFGGTIQITEAEAKGTIVILSEIFGYTVNELGYKNLDSHIGMIYGDGITVQRSQEIMQRLKDKGFASTNIVFGAGSYSLNMLSRDFLGMAIKATNTVIDIDGDIVSMPIYKDPKTDTSKKSARGLLSVHEVDGDYIMRELCDSDGEDEGLLTITYKDGKFHKLTNVFEIRKRLWG